MSEVPSEAKEVPKESHRRRNALVMTFVVVFIIAILASVTLPSTSPENSTTTAVQCVFSNKMFTVSSAQTRNFQECITAGSSRDLEFATTRNSSLFMGGTVNSEFPVDVKVLEVGYLFEGVLFSQNDTSSANFSNIHLIPDTSYQVFITNLGQNNSLSVSLKFY